MEKSFGACLADQRLASPSWPPQTATSMCRADRRREQAGRSNASRMGRWRIGAGNASEGRRCRPCARPDDRLKLEGRGGGGRAPSRGSAHPPCNRGQAWRPEGAGPLRGLLVGLLHRPAHETPLSSWRPCRRCEPQGAGLAPDQCHVFPLPFPIVSEHAMISRRIRVFFLIHPPSRRYFGASRDIAEKRTRRLFSAVQHTTAGLARELRPGRQQWTAAWVNSSCSADHEASSVFSDPCA